VQEKKGVELTEAWDFLERSSEGRNDE